MKARDDYFEKLGGHLRRALNHSPFRKTAEQDEISEFLDHNEFGLAFEALQEDGDNGYSSIRAGEMKTAKEMMDKGWEWKLKIDFAIVPAIRVQIDHEGTGFRSEIALKFMRWKLDEKIEGFRGSSHGPEGYVGWFHPKDAERIRTWLKENGAEEYAWATESTDA